MELKSHPLADRDFTMAMCAIGDIVVPAKRHRGLIESSVQELMASIAELGLLNPIIVRVTGKTEATLVAGLHRLEACRRLGWTRVPVAPLTVDALGAELVEIDENLRRTDLPYPDRVRLRHRRAQIVALKTKAEVVEMEREKDDGLQVISGDRAQELPATREKSAKGKAGRPKEPGSKSNKAKGTGVSRDTIRRDQRVVETIGDETLGKLAGTSLESQREIEALGKMPEADRRKLIERTIAGENVSAVKWLAERNKKPEPTRDNGSRDWRPKALKEFRAWRARWETTIPELKKFDRTFSSIEHALEGHTS